MKPNKITLATWLLIAAGVNFTPLMADNTPKPSTTSVPTLLIKKRCANANKHRPNAPSRQLITCLYQNGVVTISFAYPEGICEGYIMDLGNGQRYDWTIDSNDLTISLDVDITSQYYIEFTTANGNTYEGCSEDTMD